MTAEILGLIGDPWGATPDTANPLAPWPDMGSPKETLLQAAFAAAQQAIPADGSQPIGGIGSGCTLTGDQLSLLLGEVSSYWYAEGARELDLTEADKQLDGDAFTLFDLAHGGDVRGFAHRYRQRHPATGSSGPADA